MGLCMAKIQLQMGGAKAKDFDRKMKLHLLKSVVQFTAFIVCYGDPVSPTAAQRRYKKTLEALHVSDSDAKALYLFFCGIDKDHSGAIDLTEFFVCTCGRVLTGD